MYPISQMYAIAQHGVADGTDQQTILPGRIGGFEHENAKLSEQVATLTEQNAPLRGQVANLIKQVAALSINSSNSSLFRDSRLLALGSQRAKRNRRRRLHAGWAVPETEDWFGLAAPGYRLPPVGSPTGSWSLGGWVMMSVLFWPPKPMELLMQTLHSARRGSLGT